MESFRLHLWTTAVILLSLFELTRSQLQCECGIGRAKGVLSGNGKIFDLKLKDVKKSYMPWLGLVFNGRSFVGIGTLITNRHILTSARVLANGSLPFDFQVVLGAHNLRNKSDTQGIELKTVRRAIRAREGRANMKHDIVILVLETPVNIEQKKRIATVCIQENGLFPPLHMKTLFNKKSISASLRKYDRLIVGTYISSNKQSKQPTKFTTAANILFEKHGGCPEGAYDIARDNVFCVTGAVGGFGNFLTEADIGAPVMTFINGKYIQIGVVCSPTEATPTRYSLVADLDNFKEWIMEVTEDGLYCDN